jgi:hypothetical protein
MGSDEGVKYRVVEYTDAGVLVSKVMICWLIIFVILHASSSQNDSFWRLCYGKTVDLIEWTVDGLYGVVGTCIPNSHHS